MITATDTIHSIIADMVRARDTYLQAKEHDNRCSNEDTLTQRLRAIDALEERVTSYSRPAILEEIRKATNPYNTQSSLQKQATALLDAIIAGYQFFYPNATEDSYSTREQRFEQALQSLILPLSQEV